MNVAQFLIYAVGLILVIGALWWIALAAGLFEVVSQTLVLAVLVLIVGLGIMGAAFASRDAGHHHHHRHDDEY